MSVDVYDTRQCTLGEGLLWHPLRQQLFWFDIIGKRLLSRKEEKTWSWQFEEHASAAGWIDADTLLIATETGLQKFDIPSGRMHHIIALEADNPITRSNDGRADPWGGFWIGTMGKFAEDGAGKIYRFFKGRLSVLFDDISIPNAICFSPDRTTAYFADTPEQIIMEQPLDKQGWPKGAPHVLVDLRPDNLFPDGAVVDAEGCIWNAQWGAGRIARYSAKGSFMSAIQFPAKHTTCPAFGGTDLRRLFVSTASQNLALPDIFDGQLYETTTEYIGLAEPQVLLE